MNQGIFVSKNFNFQIYIILIPSDWANGSFILHQISPSYLTDELKCQWVVGVGQSLSESKTKIGEQIEKASGQETEDDGNETEDFEIEMEGEQLAAEDCVRKCIEEKKTNKNINGVIIENNEKHLAENDHKALKSVQ